MVSATEQSRWSQARETLRKKYLTSSKYRCECAALPLHYHEPYLPWTIHKFDRKDPLWDLPVSGTSNQMSQRQTGTPLKLLKSSSEVSPASERLIIQFFYFSPPPVSLSNVRHDITAHDFKIKGAYADPPSKGEWIFQEQVSLYNRI